MWQFFPLFIVQASFEKLQIRQTIGHLAPLINLPFIGDPRLFQLCASKATFGKDMIYMEVTTKVMAGKEQ